MKKFICIGFSVLLSILANVVFAQTNIYSKLHFESISIVEGLSQNNVTDIFQDSRGYLWIGTKAGLNMYDGNTLEIFKNDPEEAGSISNNMIYGICEDSQGNIWVGTENGLNKFNRQKHSFESFYSNAQNSKINISDDIVYSVFCDNEGSLWVKTPSTIDRINLSTNVSISYKYEKCFFSQQSENYRHVIFQDSYGVVWFGTTEGLAYYEPAVDEIINFKHNKLNQTTLSNNEVRCIFEDAKKQLWIGTSNGLNLFNRQTNQFNRFIPNVCISGITSSIDNQNLWISTGSQGLLYFSTKTNTYNQHLYSTTVNSITSNKTNCILKDRSNILWIGTKNGLNKLDIKPKKIKILNLDLHVSAVHSDLENIYVGTKNNGLFVVNKNSLKTTTHLLKDLEVTDISPMKNGLILVCLQKSVWVYNPKDNSIVPFEKHFKVQMHFSTENRLLKAVFEDSKNNIWLGSTSGIFRYNKNNGRIQSFDKFSNTRSLPSNSIYCFYQDSDENVWIGTEKGLVLFTYDNNKFKHVKHDSDNIKHKNTNKIYSIIEDKNKRLWVGTNSGLYSFKTADSTYRFYTEKNGLPNNQIFGLQEHNNCIWISTNKGLAKYYIEKKLFKEFDLSDGIQGYEFSINCSSKDENGLLFFGGSEGLNIFHHDSIKENKTIPNLELSKLSYFHKNIKKTIYISEKTDIVLPYKNNTVNISFSAIEFTQPNKNQYKYFLEGMDEEWHNIANQNSINFSNLPSGTYQLKVLVSNNDGIWGQEKILNIEVETPIWRTTYAKIFYILALLSILYIYIEAKTKSLRNANKTLVEKEQAAIEIAKQKEELAVKNKSITDSITYAKRIQWAIMPSRAKFKQLLPNSFILYMPKDIVSGDFYWITEIDDIIFVAAVDCTGHGVSGAFMSIIGYDLLRNITKERGIFKPSEILDYLNKALIELLTKNEMEDDTTVKDGMDMSLVAIHKNKGILEYAGAFNPLYIIRNNKLISIKGDRFSVGLGNEHEDVPFKNHVVKIQPGDMFYLFSDGYADQFGGPKEKKLKYLGFRHILLSMNNMPYVKQARALKQQFNKWKGDLEQVDDILVLGFNADNYLEKLEKPGEKKDNS